MVRFLLILIPIVITLYAMFDAITTPRDDVRGMPKWLWILLIVIVWLIGAILWFFFGRPTRGQSGGGQRGPSGPDDDPDFLSKLEWEQRKPKHD